MHDIAKCGLRYADTVPQWTLQVLRGAPKRHKKAGNVGSATLKRRMNEPLSPEHERQASIPALDHDGVQLTLGAHAASAPLLSC